MTYSMTFLKDLKQQNNSFQESRSQSTELGEIPAPSSFQERLQPREWHRVNVKTFSQATHALPDSTDIR